MVNILIKSWDLVIDLLTEVVQHNPKYKTQNIKFLICAATQSCV